MPDWTDETCSASQAHVCMTKVTQNTATELLRKVWKKRLRNTVIIVHDVLQTDGHCNSVRKRG